MTLIVDAAPLIALANRADARRPDVRKALLGETGKLVLPAPVSAEVDYLLGARLGRLARRAFLAELATGRFEVACLELFEYRIVEQLDSQYSDLDVGLADLSVVVLARRFETYRILTFDERQFRTLRPLDGGHFVLLPADAA